jgi:DNA polymerase Ligase (LigD)
MMYDSVVRKCYTTACGSADSPMPRYVILEHDHPCLHWDLMLEWGESLRTWRLDRPPAGGEPIVAERLTDHRLAYLDYEGPVSGNRGTVKRWDAGEYQLLADSPERIELEFAGDRLSGSALISMADSGRREFTSFGVR